MSENEEEETAGDSEGGDATKEETETEATPETVTVTEDETPASETKLPVKPSLKSSNSAHQLTKSNSQYRVHFPEQEVTKIVETEVIIVPSYFQRLLSHVFCCCKHPSYKP